MLPTCLRRVCPCLWNLLTSPANERKVVKALLGFPFGMLLSVGFYYAAIGRMKIPLVVRLALGGIFMMAGGVGYAVSVQARCICLLIAPTFFGKTGRSYIAAYAITFLLTGPISNIVLNAREITRAVGCSSQLSQNLTEARLRLRMYPVRQILLDLQHQALNLDTIGEEVADDFMPIRSEVEDEGDLEEMRGAGAVVDFSQGVDSRSHLIDERTDERLEQAETEGEEKQINYERKLDYKCEDVFTIGVQRCYDSLNAAYWRCKDKLPGIIEFLCLPAKVGFLCDLLNSIPNWAGLSCDSMEAVNEGFGDAYGTADDATHEMQNQFTVNMQYQVVTGEQELDMKTGEDVAKDLQYQIDTKQQWVSILSSLLGAITAFLFLRVILSAYKYQEKFVTDFKHDNIYITKYFQKIDDRRKAQNKLSLLPLKKSERVEIGRPRKVKLTAAEGAKLRKGTVMIVIRAVTFGIVLLVDKLIFEILDVIRRHSYMEFEQKGEHLLNITVYGRGGMGNLVRSLITGFNTQQSLHQVTSNQVCLPRPSKPEWQYALSTLGVLALVWCFMVIESYALRLRHYIAAFFFPKREKQRILFLYNDMLKKRKGFMKYTQRQVRKKAREKKLQMTASVAQSFQRACPKLCCCLSWCGLGKRSCLICGDSETKAYVSCTTPGCRFGYCPDCWKDIEMDCYACRPPPDFESDTPDTDDSDGGSS